jgi:Flp pilus assembly protein TadB
MSRRVLVAVTAPRRRLALATAGRATSPTARGRGPAWSRRRRLGVAVSAGLGAGLLLGSPAAGLIAAGYTLLAQSLWHDLRTARRDTARREDALDLIAAIAAELRAGGAGTVLLVPDDELDRAVAGARRLADTTGAPLADLLERLEAQCRAADRADAAAQAQAAGAQLTAVLLAALPLGGVGLGHLIGADALGILLHTPIGLACASGAAVLQAAGLAWPRRLQRGGPARGGLTAAGRAARTASGGPADGVGARRRLRRLPLRRAPRPPSGRTPWLFGALAGAAVVALLPSAAGTGLGLVVAAVTVLVLRRMEPAAVRAEREQALADLPWAVDLVAAALRAGAPLDGALSAVAAALDGPLAARLQRIGHSLRLGATPDEAWQHLADLPAARRLTAAAVRSSASGSALSGALRRCSDDLRADASVRRQAGAQRAGVLIVLPLGLCFLPAFVLAGLVPVVLAVLGEVL